MTLTQILEAVSSFNGIDWQKDIKNKLRVSGNAKKAIRQYCYLAQKFTNHSFKDIGSMIDRDHASVSYHVKESRNDIDIYREDKSHMTIISSLLTGEITSPETLIYEVICRKSRNDNEMKMVKSLFERFILKDGLTGKIAV